MELGTRYRLRACCVDARVELATRQAVLPAGKTVTMQVPLLCSFVELHTATSFSTQGLSLQQPATSYRRVPHAQ